MNEYKNHRTLNVGFIYLYIGFAKSPVQFILAFSQILYNRANI